MSDMRIHTAQSEVITPKLSGTNRPANADLDSVDGAECGMQPQATKPSCKAAACQRGASTGTPTSSSPLAISSACIGISVSQPAG